MYFLIVVFGSKEGNADTYDIQSGWGAVVKV